MGNAKDGVPTTRKNNMKKDELNFSYAAHKRDGSDWTSEEADELTDLIVDWIESKNADVGGGTSLRSSAAPFGDVPFEPVEPEPLEKDSKND